MRIFYCTRCDHVLATGPDDTTAAHLAHAVFNAAGAVTATHADATAEVLVDRPWNPLDPDCLADSAWARDAAAQARAATSQR